MQKLIGNGLPDNGSPQLFSLSVIVGCAKENNLLTRVVRALCIGALDFLGTVTGHLVDRFHITTSLHKRLTRVKSSIHFLPQKGKRISIILIFQQRSRSHAPLLTNNNVTYCRRFLTHLSRILNSGSLLLLCGALPLLKGKDNK